MIWEISQHNHPISDSFAAEFVITQNNKVASCTKFVITQNNKVAYSTKFVITTTCI